VSPAHRRRGWLRTWVAVASLVAVAGCSTGGEPDDSAAAASPSRSASGAPPSSPAASSSAPTASPTAPVDPVSLQALMTKHDGRSMRTRHVLLRTADYTRYAITYRSEDLRISGVMNVPRGKGPFPVLVLLHGYIDPAVYNTGQGLMREQDYLAREGYVALHIDYRGHAGSDPAPRAEQQLRLGYTVDAINAVHAVRRSSLPYLDGDRVGLLGRSMGGGVLYSALVAQPGLVDAAVAFAPVSSDTVDNFNRWTRPERSDVASDIIRAHGSPERNPDFWRDVSPRTFFDRITEPLLIHHGTADESCPYRWSRTSLRALEQAGVDARLRTYPGEAHAFGPQWPLSMRRTVAFLDGRLKA
jgi:dipeptidyl aminopeptidase/acylaminoacyl peptidase